jgi:hypothetical protein
MGNLAHAPEAGRSAILRSMGFQPMPSISAAAIDAISRWICRSRRLDRWARVQENPCYGGALPFEEWDLQ